MHYPTIPFERYADDTVCHCRTEKQALFLKSVLVKRFAECGLNLNEDKTRIVYCKNSKRTELSSHTAFDYLGFTFRPRVARNSKTGRLFTAFTPSISKKAKMRIRETIRKWSLTHMCQYKMEEIAGRYNAVISG